MDVHSVGTWVSAVITTFVQAAKLLENFKAANNATGNTALLDLENSLLLGPPIVRGQYDLNFRRFGNGYETGDQEAQDSLQGIVTSLQLHLLGILRAALRQNQPLDFPGLQAASDDGRLDTIMCLYSLSQRMGVYPNPASALPSNLAKLEITADMSEKIPSPMINPRPSTKSLVDIQQDLPRLSLAQISTSTSPSASTKTKSHRSPASMGSDASLFVPMSPLSPLLIPRKRDVRTGSIDSSKGSPSSGNCPPSYPAINLPPGVAELESSFQSPRDVPAIQSNSSVYSESVYSERSTRPPLGSGAESVSSVLGPGRSGSQDKNSRSSQERVPTEQSAHSSRSGSLLSGFPGLGRKRTSASASSDDSPRTILGFGRRRVPPSARDEMAQSGPNSLSTVSSAVAELNIVHIPGGLFLPGEENQFAGFCKGAWKLQYGMKKSFRLDFKRTSSYIQISTWRCAKCHFDGPMGQAPPVSRKGAPAPAQGYAYTRPSAGSSSQDFDQRLRIHRATGIRYRWPFLAKSHISMRTAPKSNDGSDCQFGCIFCCVEQQGPAPIFSNLDSFMQHLRIHGGTAGASGDARSGLLPPRELLDWTKCVIGRIGEETEGFDLNIPAPVAEIGE